MPSKSKKQARMMAAKETGVLKGPVHQRAKELAQSKRDIAMLKRKRKRMV